MWGIITAWVLPCVLAYMFLSWIRRWVRIDNHHKRYILITGCDHGYGNLLAQRLDMMGCKVFAACSSEAAKNRLQQMTSSNLRAFTLDVTSSDQVKQAVDFVNIYIPGDQGLWALVNNAETPGDVIGPLEWHSINDIMVVMDTNLLGTIRMTQAFLPLLKKAKGRVINLSHIHGRLGHPVTMPYSISKAAVESFSDSIRPHLNLYGVSVHVIEPGDFQTDISIRLKVRKAVQQGWKSLPWLSKEDFGEAYMDKLTSHMTSSIDNASPKVNKVIKAYLHAVTARCPRSRYTVGGHAYFCWIPLSYMPSVITDFFISRWTSDLVPACVQETTTQAQTGDDGNQEK